MVTDKETNFIYFSGLLASDSCYNNACSRITAILDKHQIGYGFLEATQDIWCRDFMPVQKSETELVQFRYEPSYLEDDSDLQSDPETVLQANNIKATFSDINLDGGNVLRWHDRVIISDRIFEENRHYPDKTKLIKKLETLLEADVIVIPALGKEKDMTGHADGMVRFVDRDTLIGNSLALEYADWRRKMKKITADHGLTYLDLPFFEANDPGHEESAVGCYVNYLEVGNLIVMPVFETRKNKDEEALDILSQVFSARKIETVNINEIAWEGGLLNCITWNIPAQSSNSPQV